MRKLKEYEFVFLLLVVVEIVSIILFCIVEGKKEEMNIDEGWEK